MKKLFGTDGIRGEAGKFPLDEKTIAIIGASLARQLKEKQNHAPRLIVGRDTRESGAWIEAAFCAGAASVGAECKSAGIITTPGVAFLTGKFDFDAGIVISASHNPFADNGIKIFSPSGRKIDEATEREIERDISIYHLSISSYQDLVESAGAEKYQQVYLDYLAEEFRTLDLSDLKIVLDCANGAASNLAPPLFRKFGADVISINDAPDGKNINENCGSLHLENLQAQVLAERADFGAAFDGDADRSLFVDERGNIVDGDATLWIMANHLAAHGRLNKQTIVATVMSNLGLENALKSKNIEFWRTPVGDKYVLQKLIETGASVGGEQSGHIIFPFHSLVGDGMLTTLFLLAAMSECGKTLSELTGGFVQLPQILVNIKVAEKKPFEDVPEIAAAARKTETELGDKGRLLLRYSGTENLARVMIEGENQAAIEAQATHLAQIIKQNLG